MVSEEVILFALGTGHCDEMTRTYLVVLVGAVKTMYECVCE